MGDVGKAIQSVGDGVKKVANDVGKTWDRNREEVERGDLGKAGRAVFKTWNNFVEAGKTALDGDTQGAGNKLAGAVMYGSSPLAKVAEASPSAKNFFKTKTGDIVTFGLGGDSVDIGERSAELMGGRNTNSSDFWTTGRLLAKQAAVVYGATNYDSLAAQGGDFASKAGTYAADNPLATALVAGKLAEGDAAGAGAALLDAYEPGLGNLFSPARNQLPENFPESAGYGDGYYQASSAGIDKTKILIVGAAVVGAALLAKGLKK